MFYCSFTSLVHFWPPSIFNPGYAYVVLVVAVESCGGLMVNSNPVALAGPSSEIILLRLLLIRRQRCTAE